MSRKPEISKNSAPHRSASALRSLRGQVDRLDLQILKLVNERARIAAELGRYKAEPGTELFTPARDDEVLSHVLESNKGPLDEAAIKGIYREIISGSRAIQREPKVAYLGPEYSYSHLAALDRFGQATEYVRVGSIAAVFEEVNRGHSDYGLVPLENSADGRLADSLDMFIRLPQLKICGEARLRIHHNLLANCEQQEIRRVYSKPQALAQCRNWLSKNVPHASLHEVASTATAAELAQREPGAAAVASRQAAVRYGLRVLFEDIADSPYNETRFAIIGNRESSRTGKDKTALMLKTTHHPGALAEALGIFKQNKLNLTWIESFPAKSAKPEYVFFVDFEGHQEDAKVKKALGALDARCEQVSILGSYPAAQVVG
jgi:chorismate mutase/prephenate dehydratase